MLGIGWTEMLVLGVMALIVIGPKELPALMQKLGRFASTVRRMGADFQREINKTTGLDEVRNLRSSITQPLKATTDAIRKEFNTTTPSGQVKPSGALKPSNPGAESVVDEIHAAAGMPPRQTAADAMKTAVQKGAAAKASAAAGAAAGTAAAAAEPKPARRKDPVKAARVPKATPAPTTPVAAADLEPVAQARKPASKAAAVKSPAPAEAVPEDPKPARKRAAAAKPEPKPDAGADKPATRKSPAARKPKSGKA
jgi:sec-independent protein translocase protein TatB